MMIKTGKKQIFNPFLPLNEYIPDGEPHVFGDRVYLFGSHDKEGGEEYCALGNYVVYSAPVTDVRDWRCEGEIYRSNQDPGASGGKALMYAPDVVQGDDGCFYLYYNLSGKNVAGWNPISVAVCSTPAGRYSYYGFVRNPDGSPLRRFITGDPAVINDNGVIRLYYGWSLSSRAAEAHGREPTQPIADVPTEVLMESLVQAQMMMFHKSREEILSGPDGTVMGANTVTLADDMVTLTSEPVRIVPGEFTAQGTGFEGHAFYEASSIRKVGDTYYFIFSSQLSHELCYAVSTFPDKSFRYGGTIISNGDVGYQGRKEEDRLNLTANNHGSIENINGQWYIFYHRQTHSSTYSRQACAEPITILSDGSIPQVEMTSCGLNGGPLPAEGVFPASIACILTNGAMPHITNRTIDADIPFIVQHDDERFITGIKEGTLIGYKYFTFRGSVRFAVMTRGNGDGKLTVAVGMNRLGEIGISPSENWQENSMTVLADETAALYLTYQGSGQIEILSLSFSDG